MAQPNPQQTYKQLEPLFKNDFLRWGQKQANQQQYALTSIPSHTHNGLDSLQVSYPTLKGVQSYLVSNTITLSAAQIKTMNTSPVIVIAPPTTRSVIIVHSVTARLTYGGIPYTGLHDMEFHYTNGAGTQVTDVIPPTFINSTSNAFYHAPAVTASFAPIEGGSGANGQIVAFVNTANPAAGNSTITLVIHYHIVSFST